MGALRACTGRLLRLVRRVHVLPWRAVRRGQPRRAGGENRGRGPRVEQGVLAQGGYDCVFFPVRLLLLFLFLRMRGADSVDSLVRLLLEYARLMSMDREAMSYQG